MNQPHYENCIILLMGIAGTGKRTIGTALSKKSNFKLALHDWWMEPILNLLCKDSMWELDENGWKKLNEARDVFFSTIADACPKADNFIITYEMLDKDPYHQTFYDKVLDIVNKREAHFLPVRLICSEEELTKRVQAEDRKQFFKTRDAVLVRDRVRNHEVFYTHHKNEITLDVTKISPGEAVNKILEALSVNFPH